MCFGGVVVVDVLSKQAKPSQMCQDMDDVEVDDLILRAPLGSLMMMMTSYSLFVWSDQISRSACQGPTVVLLLLIRHRDSRLRGERKQFLWPHMGT